MPENKKEKKNRCSVSMTMIAIVAGALWTISKFLEKSLEVLEISGRIETVQIVALLRSVKIRKSFF